MPRGPVAAIVAVLAGVVVVAVVATRPPAPVALTPSPAPIASPTLSPTATPSSTPTASPSPTPQGLYVSKLFGFALELPPPWRTTSCPGRDPTATTLPHFESFTSVSVLDEGLIGGSAILVVVEANPQGLSPEEFARTAIIFGFPYNAGGTPALHSVTFAGRPAAELAYPNNGPKAYLVGDRGRMFEVVGMPGSRTPAEVVPALEAVLRVVATFRFASAGEIAAKPDPTPFPAGAPSATALADLLATAFRQKDVATLERLLGPCVHAGARQSDCCEISRERFVASLREQFANGLTVDVDVSTVRTDPTFFAHDVLVRSYWTARPPSVGPPPTPGQTLVAVDLVLTRTAGGFFWLGSISGVQ